MLPNYGRTKYEKCESEGAERKRNCRNTQPPQITGIGDERKRKVIALPVSWRINGRIIYKTDRKYSGGGKIASGTQCQIASEGWRETNLLRPKRRSMMLFEERGQGGNLGQTLSQSGGTWGSRGKETGRKRSQPGWKGIKLEGGTGRITRSRGSF